MGVVVDVGPGVGHVGVDGGGCMLVVEGGHSVDMQLHGCFIFSTAVSTVVLMQSVLCKPYIFTKQPKISRQCTPPSQFRKVAVRQRPLVEGGSTMISIAFMFS